MRGPGERARFFYLSLAHGVEKGSPEGNRIECVGSANYVIELYGIRKFIADLERGREYWRESPCCCSRRNADSTRTTGAGVGSAIAKCDCGRQTVSHSILTWATEDGFAELMREFDPDFPYQTASQWRGRDQIRLLTNIASALGVSFK